MKICGTANCRLTPDEPTGSYVGNITANVPSHSCTIKISFSLIGPEEGSRVLRLCQGEKVIATYQERDPLQATPLPKQAFIGFLATLILAAIRNLELILDGMRQEAQEIGVMSESNVRLATEVVSRTTSLEDEWGPFPGFNDQELLDLLATL